MKTILTVIILLTFSQNSFAFFKKNDDFYANKCLERGVEQVLQQAKSFGCLDEDEFQQAQDYVYVSSVDNRAYNPSTYIWYKIDMTCDGFDSVQTMVQYYKGKCH